MNMYFMQEVIRLYGSLFLSKFGKEAAGDSIEAIYDIVKRGKCQNKWRYILCEDCGNVIAKPSGKKGCPVCHGAGKASWDQLKISKIVEDIFYYHAVFTVPSELNPLYLLNKRFVGDAIYEAAAETLLEMSKERLGGQLGAVIVFHSWAQDLTTHPHVHCYIPGRVLQDDGTWKNISVNRLLPYALGGVAFKTKLIKALRNAWKTLTLPAQENGDDAPLVRDQFLDSLYHMTWIAYNKQAISVRNAAKYLSNNLKRTALAAYRIQKIDSEGVSFKWRDSRNTGEMKTMTLPGDEFLRRMLLHTFPPGFKKIRCYGPLTIQDKGEISERFASQEKDEISERFACQEKDEISERFANQEKGEIKR